MHLFEQYVWHHLEHVGEIVKETEKTFTVLQKSSWSADRERRIHKASKRYLALDTDNPAAVVQAFFDATRDTANRIRDAEIEIAEAKKAARISGLKAAGFDVEGSRS